MRKVLLILASEDFRSALQTALQHDYEVSTCSNVEDGIELLRQEPDALVIDLLLPGTDGLSFLESQQDLRPPVTLVLTPLIDSHIIEALSNLQVSYVIRYPCRISTVTRRLDEQA